MVITRQQNATAEANPTVKKFSKEQNDLKMKELREFAANTEVGQCFDIRGGALAKRPGR